jgi:SAM-dependent methyltransferase
MPNSGYDTIAAEYYDPGHQTSRNFDAATTLLLSRLQIGVIGGPVLEVGAGRGRAVEFLKVDASQVVQLDNSEAMLQLHHREPSLLRVHADACAIPLIGQHFGAVVGFLVDPFMGLDFLAEAYRMLLPEGMLLLTLPTREWGKPLRDHLGIDVMTTRFKVIGREKTVILPSLLHSRERLHEMLLFSSFKNIEISDGYLPVGQQPVSPDIETVARAMQVGPEQVPIIHVITANR